MAPTIYIYHEALAPFSFDFHMYVCIYIRINIYICVLQEEQGWLSPAAAQKSRKSGEVCGGISSTGRDQHEKCAPRKKESTSHNEGIGKKKQCNFFSLCTEVSLFFPFSIFFVLAYFFFSKLHWCVSRVCFCVLGCLLPHYLLFLWPLLASIVYSYFCS